MKALYIYIKKKDDVKKVGLNLNSWAEKWSHCSSAFGSNTLQGPRLTSLCGFTRNTFFCALLCLLVFVSIISKFKDPLIIHSWQVWFDQGSMDHCSCWFEQPPASSGTRAEARFALHPNTPPFFERDNKCLDWVTKQNICLVHR